MEMEKIFDLLQNLSKYMGFCLLKYYYNIYRNPYKHNSTVKYYKMSNYPERKGKWENVGNIHTAFNSIFTFLIKKKFKDEYTAIAQQLLVEDISADFKADITRITTN